MNKKEYLEEVKKALNNVDAEVVLDVIEDFENHFDIGMEEGRSEEAIAEELGDPKDIAKQFADEYGTKKQPEREDKAEKESTSSSEETGDNVKKLILSAISADIDISKSTDGKFYINYYNNNSLRNKTTLRFEGHQEGSTFYAREYIHKAGLFGVSVLKGSDTSINIQVPDGFEGIDIKTTSGDIDVNDVTLAEFLNASSVSGDIELDCVKVRDFYGSSTSGDIDLTGVDGERFQLKTTSGDLEVEDCSMKECLVESVSGDITIDSHKNSGYQVTGKTVSGDVYVARASRGVDEDGNKCYVVGEEPFTNIFAKTVSGDITVE